MPVSFGPGGNSASFGNKKLPEDLPGYLENLGLNGYEIQCGRGVRISEDTYALLPGLARKHGISLSIHAPYYISLSSAKEESRTNSLRYIRETARAAKRLGASKIVVHSGSRGKLSRDQALDLAKDTLDRAQKELDENDLGEVILCPETMGKNNQLGTIDEVLSLCELDDRMLPCVDFGHLYARAQGALRHESDYARILDKIEQRLGICRLRRIHIHFSKIEFTAGGEKLHLNFSDQRFGPWFEPLINQIVKRQMEPSIICESAGMQAEDAAEMARYYREIISKNPV